MSAGHYSQASFPVLRGAELRPALARRPLKQKLKDVRREVRAAKNENAARPAGVDLARAISGVEDATPMCQSCVDIDKRIDKFRGVAS